jgi:hypothetical protein
MPGKLSAYVSSGPIPDGNELSLSLKHRAFLAVKEFH